MLENDPRQAPPLDRLARPRRHNGNVGAQAVKTLGKAGRQPCMEALDSPVFGSVPTAKLLESAAALSDVSASAATAQADDEYSDPGGNLRCRGWSVRIRVASAGVWVGYVANADHAGHCHPQPAHTRSDGAEPWRSRRSVSP